MSTASDDSYPAQAPTMPTGQMTDSELAAETAQAEIWIARTPHGSDAYRSHRDRLSDLDAERQRRRQNRAHMRGYDPALRF